MHPLKILKDSKIQFLTQSKIKFYEVILYSQKVLHFTDLAPCVEIMNFSSLSLVFSIITIIRDIFILKLFFRIYIHYLCVCTWVCMHTMIQVWVSEDNFIVDCLLFPLYVSLGPNLGSQAFTWSSFTFWKTMLVLKLINRNIFTGEHLNSNL